MANDTNLGISLVMKVVDQGSQILSQMSAALDKIGISAQQASSKASSAGSQMEKAFKGVTDHLDRASKAVSSFSERMTDVGTTLTAIGAAVTAPMGLAVKTAADFETAMNRVRAAGEIDISTKDGQAQFEQLTARARDLGSTTQFTATQVAQGMEELSKAGFRTEQIIASIGPALNLAFAEGRGMKETAEDLVRVLAGFELQADQAARVTDVLSKTSLATTTSMAGLVEGLKYVASLANNVGLSLEETTAYLGIFAQKGIDASMAGTGLRRLLGDLSNPSKEASAALSNLGVEIAKNKDGSVNLTETFTRLGKAGLSTANAFKIFGDQGGNVAVVASKNIEAIKELAKQNDNAGGSLNRFVGIVNQGLLPAWKTFTSAVGDLAIQLAGPFLQGLKWALDGISSLLRGLSNLAKEYPGTSKAIAGVAGAIAILVTAAGAASLAVAGLAYAFGGLTKAIVGSGILSLGSSVLGLIPSFSAMTAAVTSFTGALGASMTAIVAFAATPVGLVAVAIAAILGTLAGAYKILSDRAEAAAIQAETLKRSHEDMKRAMSEGFDPTKQLQGVSGAALTADPYTDVLAKRKQAVADFVGWNEKLTQARESDAQSWFGGKSKETETAERSIALARQNLDTIQAEINARIDQKQAVEGVAKAHEQSANAALQEVKTNEQLLQLAKDRADIEVRLIQDSVKGKEDAIKLELEQAKVRISETVRDEGQAQQAISALVADSSQKRIALAEQEYIQLRMTREKGFDEQKAAYEKMIAAGEKVADSLKGLQEVEKQRTESQIADSRKLSQAVVTELNTQVKAKDEQVKKVKSLEGQLRDEQRASADALRSLSDANLNESAKLQASVTDVNAKLKEAVRLAPSMPEKALELFKQVRSESAGLIQNIEQFNDKLRNAANAGQDALRKVNAYGLTGADKYKSEISDIQLMIQRANDAIAGGRFGEAENLYKSVMSAAQGLPGSAVKTGNEQQDAANLEAAKADARVLIQIASGGMTDAINVQKAQAEETNRQAKANIEAAQRAIEDLIRAQIQSANALIAALNANTAALQGKITQGQPGQPGQAGQGAGGIGSASDMTGAVAAGVQEGIAQASGTGSQSGQYDQYGYGATPGGQQPDLSSLTRAEQSSSSYTDFLLAQTDQVLGQSQSESAGMASRMAELKYLESQAKNLDRKEAAGYVKTEPGVLGKSTFGMGDSDISGALGKLYPSASAGGSSIFDNLGAIVDSIQQQGGIMGQLKGAGGFGDIKGAITEAMREVTDTMKNEFSGIGQAISDTASDGISSALEQSLKIDVAVDDNRASLGAVTRY